MIRFIITVPAMVLFAASFSWAGLVEDDFAAGLAALAQRDFPRAERLFRNIAKSDPNSHEALNNLAVACAEQGREEEAAVTLRAALRLRPEYERARDNLAAVYVRLAVKELLEAARRAPPPRRQALAARARVLLEGGPHLSPVELLAEANSLAGTSPLNLEITPHGDAATPGASRVLAVVSPTPERQATKVALEPRGTEVLVIDPGGRTCVRYRRDRNGLNRVGRWPVEVRGELLPGAVLSATKRNDTEVYLRDLAERRHTVRLTAAGNEGAASGNVVALTQADFQAAIPASRWTPWLAIIAAAEPPLRFDSGLLDRLRIRIEAWRAAWATRSLDGYGVMYVEDFVDARGRSRRQWWERKQSLFRRSGQIKIRLADVTILATEKVALTRFIQDYESALERSRSLKQLGWRLVGDDWQIASEVVLSSGVIPAMTE